MANYFDVDELYTHWLTKMEPHIHFLIDHIRNPPVSDIKKLTIPQLHLLAKTSSITNYIFTNIKDIRKLWNEIEDIEYDKRNIFVDDEAKHDIFYTEHDKSIKELHLKTFFMIKKMKARFYELQPPYKYATTKDIKNRITINDAVAAVAAVSSSISAVVAAAADNPTHDNATTISIGGGVKRSCAIPAASSRASRRSRREIRRSKPRRSNRRHKTKTLKSGSPLRLTSTE